MSTIGDVTITDTGEYGIIGNGGTITPLTIGGAGNTVMVSSGAGTTGIGTLSFGEPEEDLMERWIMNRITIDHKVQEQELMKLKEVAPDYANEIKENLAKNAARDMIKKITFTKKHDKDADTHHFIGRVWCFTEQELKEFIKESRNV